jgi:alpha/beta superfamily hydrolase
MTWQAEDIGVEQLDMVGDDGVRITGLLSYPVDEASGALIIIPPGFERRMHNYGALSYVLVKHGYTTLRFDLRNHLGMSDGEVADFSMGSIASDVALALRHATAHHAAKALYVLAPSLSARGAIRALASEASASGFVGILPVVDLRRSLALLAGDDLLAKWESKEVTDPSRLYRIGKQMVKAASGRDALDENWGGMPQVQTEIAAISCPVSMITAEQDEWVRPEDVSVALSGSSRWPRQCTMIEATSHDVARNLPVMRLLLELVVTRLDTMENLDRQPVVPEFSALIDVVAAERQWANGEYRGLPLNGH